MLRSDLTSPMKANLQLVGAALVLVLMYGRAHACSCQAESASEEDLIERELHAARLVVVATVVSTKQTPALDSPNYIIEDAEFVVSEVLKGDVVAGDKIRTRSHLGPGLCGRSARNIPVWLDEIEATGEPAKPAVVSEEWLIYGHGTEPFELSLCDRSMPLSHRGSEDLKRLRALLSGARRARVRG